MNARCFVVVVKYKCVVLKMKIKEFGVEAHSSRHRFLVRDLQGRGFSGKSPVDYVMHVPQSRSLHV